MHAFAKSAKRRRVLKLMTFRALFDGDLQDTVQKAKLAKFLARVTKGYRQDVEYHNDLHGADVM